MFLLLMTPLGGFGPWNYVVCSVAFSHDGKTLASASGLDGVKLWDPISGKELHALTGAGWESVAFSPDGQTVLTAYQNQGVRIWDTATGKELRKLADKGHCAVLSPDGKMVAESDFWQGLRLCDPASGKELLKLTDSNATPFAFSPNGKEIAIVGKSIKLLDVSSGKQLREFKELEAKSAPGASANTTNAFGMAPNFCSVAFSPDGKILAAGSEKKSIKLWDTATGEQILTFPGKGNVVCLAFSPDGKILACGSGKTVLYSWQKYLEGIKPLILWDTASGRELHALPVN